MSVRKRKWKTNGEAREAWIADYVDAKGQRRRKAFARKKDADAFLLNATTEVRDGVHVTDGDTITIAEAGKLWVKSGEASNLERTSLDQRRQHLAHINLFLGQTKLNKITVPGVREFQDQLREAGRSAPMVKRITVSLGSILADAQGRGLTVRNPVHERSRARSSARASEKRLSARLQVGRDIPSRAEIKALLTHLSGRWRPLLLTAIFTGMRASELRGLAWSAVDLEAKAILVRQRADAYNEIGFPKSEAGHRTVPIPPVVANALKEWRLACPRGRLDLVFPNGAGKVESHANIVNRGLIPAMTAAGVVNKDGKSKYTGLHSLRHFYASWSINPLSLGGQGLPPKVVQERMGHASIVMTMDTYGHLFPRGDDDEALAIAAASLLGT